MHKNTTIIVLVSLLLMLWSMVDVGCVHCLL